MHYYRNTNLNFCYFTIFPISFVGLCFGINVEKNVSLGIIIVLFCYLLLVISVALPIAKRRKEITEIQKNGRCYRGTVEKLVEVSVENTITRFGTIEYDTAYYLKVLPEGESNANHFVYSDVLMGSKGQKIFKEVLIYDWYGKTFVFCRNSKTKQHYEVEQTKKVVHYSWNRMLLVFVNRLFIIIYGVVLIIMMYIWLIGA